MFYDNIEIGAFYDSPNCIWNGGRLLLDKDYDLNIRRKIHRFQEKTGTKKALQLTFVTTYGVKLNMYSQRISSQVTMDDLFIEL